MHKVYIDFEVIEASLTGVKLLPFLVIIDESDKMLSRSNLTEKPIWIVVGDSARYQVGEISEI